MESKSNNFNSNQILQENKTEVENNEQLELQKARQNEMELTDKPLKSMFLFKNMGEMPINCSEKDSITYKIGEFYFIFLIL